MMRLWADNVRSCKEVTQLLNDTFPNMTPINVVTKFNKIFLNNQLLLYLANSLLAVMYDMPSSLKHKRY